MECGAFFKKPRIGRDENRVIGTCICLWNFRDYAVIKQHRGTYFQGRHRTGGALTETGTACK